jgi:3-isopropylmalate/(R)-2-methylmalate dehydratase small subunit
VSALRGRAHRYGDNVNTDVIIPARYLTTSDVAELAAHCMEDLDPEFVQKVQAGDVIVGGWNFGCGSSREHAPLAIKGAGVSCVIAVSFARIFYRNAVNVGLPALVCPEASAQIGDGDEVTIELGSGKIEDVTSGRRYQAEPFPDFLEQIIAVGGLRGYIAKRVSGG